MWVCLFIVFTHLAAPSSRGTELHPTNVIVVLHCVRVAPDQVYGFIAGYCCAAVVVVVIVLDATDDGRVMRMRMMAAVTANEGSIAAIKRPFESRCPSLLGSGTNSR